MGRKVCLSGFAKYSRDWANKQPEGTEIWGMNEGHTFLTAKVARWFQVHPPHWNQRTVDKQGWPSGNYGRHPAHVEWLSKQTIPVYMQKPDPRIPSAVEYPLDAVISKYRRYLTSTIAYMLALLLYEHEQYRWWKPWTWKKKVDSVILTGIEMGVGTEYMIQRPCVEYWIGKLESSGVHIGETIHGSAMLNGMLYAVDHDAPILEGDLVPVMPAEMVNNASDLPVVQMEEEDSNDEVAPAPAQA